MYLLPSSGEKVRELPRYLARGQKSTFWNSAFGCSDTRRTHWKAQL